MEITALDALGAELLDHARFASSGRYAVTVHGGHVSSLRQTVIGIVAGRTLVEHENSSEITLQLIRGRARVLAGSEIRELAPGDYLVVPLEWDAFEALDDTVVLLTAAVLGSPD